MKRKKIRAGLAGAGFAASFHYESLCRIYNVEIQIAGVYSPTRHKREAFASERNIKAFGSLDALIDASDVIHVCTPPAVHESIVVAALSHDKSVIVEKPFTGYFGEGLEDFRGDLFPKDQALKGALDSVQRLLAAEEQSQGRILYAENWIYAPAIQKEKEILEKTGAQILWIHGEEAHSGSHSPVYGVWRYAGGGAMIGKGCHPLTAALYLKRVEGRQRSGAPIRPRSITARTAALTRLETFADQGHLRTDYQDIEDFSLMHIVFEDGMLADIFSSEIVMGGIHNWLEICANNHRTICNINPSTVMQTYNPVEANFQDIYIVEKIGTKQGWSNPAPQEDFLSGYPGEMQAFYEAIACNKSLESDSSLAADTISTIYSGYVSSERNGEETEITLL
jgi:predicted dehydrogenase